MSETAAPTEIDEYKILRALGRGGMGAVFLARDRELDRLVAIKMIDRAGHHPDAVARFRIEARALARLAHANVVTVHRIGEHGGQPFIVYEYVEGTSLDQRARPTTRAQAHAIALGLVRGLAAAHREGILHRDLKPGNAMLALDGTVKLLDFGLAKLRDGDGGELPPIAALPVETSLAEAQTIADTPRPTTAPAPPAAASPASTLTFDGAAATPVSDALTRAGARMGTPRYMCPEAWRGEPMTAASDVYSLGLVLWELFADRHPFDGVALDALAARACDEDVPSLTTAGVAPALAALIDRCVRRDPAERPTDAVELLAALERIDAPPTAAAAPAPPQGRGLAFAMAAVIVLGGGGGGVALWMRTRYSVPVGPAIERAAIIPPGAGAPHALTRMGGCSDGPVFIDASTIAFTHSQGDDVDVYTLSDGKVARITTATGWDWRPSMGRHPGELLYVRDGDDGHNRVAAYSRAAATDREVARGYAAVASGSDLYYVSDEWPGELRRKSDDGADVTITTLPEGRAPELLAVAASGQRLVVMVSDRTGPSAACIVELSDAAPRCLTTPELQLARPAFQYRGRYLLYAARSGIRRYDLDRADDVVIVPGVRASGGVALSPDETRLVFSDCRSYGSIVAIPPTAGGAPEVLIDDGLSRNPRGGPGGVLGYVAPGDQGGTRLMVKPPGAPARVLVDDPGELGSPAFAPAGDRVAYAKSGDDGGLRVIAISGGKPETWTTGAGDRGPTWTAAGGLAFTRLGAGGAPSAMLVTAPGKPPRVLAAGWVVQDTDRASGAIVLLRDGHVALIDPERPDPGRPKPVALGTADGTAQNVVAAPDGSRLFVLGGTSGSEFFSIDRATGTATTIHTAPGGQTVGSPALLDDGRVVYRAEIWLGELYEIQTPPLPPQAPPPPPLPAR